MAEDALDVALLVAAAVERVGGEYFVGGSVASSLQGEPRATNDIDFVVALSRVRAFAEAVDDATRNLCAAGARPSGWRVMRRHGLACDE